MLRIGLDCDDVICDFWGTYVAKYGIEESYMITRRCQRELRLNKKFWENLPPLHRPDFKVTLWCTKRVNPKSYTKRWLQLNDLPTSPVYQVYTQTRNKADYIKGKVDVFVDDSPSNYEAMNKAGVPCLLMDHPNNRNYQTKYRVYSLKYQDIADVYTQLISDGFKQN